MKKKDKGCSNCRYQMTGFDGGFFGLPFTCECSLFGETENRKDCSKFEKKITKDDLLDEIAHLKSENEQLRQSKEFWRKNAMVLLMQVRRLTPRMTEKEIMEFAKELDEKGGK